MQLCLIRHGECEASAASDEERGLTTTGNADVAKVSELLRRQKLVAPQVIFSSPMKRALQTAELINAPWALEIQKADWLQPLVEPSTVLEKLRSRSEDHLVLIGHLPNLGLLLSTLLWGLPAREVSLPRGAAALLDVEAWEPGAAKLGLFIKPEEIP